jgi:methylated-DNA-[protein]-cysteine S-methyltransferase
MKDVTETTMTFFATAIPSPVGPLTLVATERHLAAVLWEHDDPKRVRIGPHSERPDHPVLRQARRELAEYFARERTSFDVPLGAAGTPFQKAVWAALVTIPYGETRGYAALARQIGRPTAARAVGAANGRNPLSIIVPCHRVVGSDGSLTGFAGGLDAKRYLLELETRPRRSP